MRKCMKIGIMELQSNSIVDIKAALGLGEKMAGKIYTCFSVMNLKVGNL